MKKKCARSKEKIKMKESEKKVTAAVGKPSGIRSRRRQITRKKWKRESPGQVVRKDDVLVVNVKSATSKSPKLKELEENVIKIRCTQKGGMLFKLKKDPTMKSSAFRKSKGPLVRWRIFDFYPKIQSSSVTTWIWSQHSTCSTGTWWPRGCSHDYPDK